MGARWSSRKPEPQSHVGSFYATSGTKLHRPIVLFQPEAICSMPLQSRRRKPPRKSITYSCSCHWRGKHIRKVRRITRSMFLLIELSQSEILGKMLLIFVPNSAAIVLTPRAPRKGTGFCFVCNRTNGSWSREETSRTNSDRNMLELLQINMNRYCLVLKTESVELKIIKKII